MLILITNERLDLRAGSDSFIRDLARGLQKLGHYVMAYGSDPRQGRRLVERDSISVATDLERLPVRPDIIHARHHLDAMTAIAALPGVPVVHHCIGPAWSTVLPVHPRIHRYIAPATGIANWIARQGPIPRDRIDLVHSAVDPLRLASTARPAASPERLLVYDDQMLPDSPIVPAIKAAADGLGLSVELAGRRLGRVFGNAGTRLPDYDIVFARGRAAIEAIACGCAVVVVSHDRCGEMVDEGNFDRLREADFSVDATRPPTPAERIGEILRGYSAPTTAALAAMVGSRCDFPAYAAAIESVYRSAIAMHESHVEDIRAEEKAIAAYLAGLVPALKRQYSTQRTFSDMSLWSESTFRDLSAKMAAIQVDSDTLQG